MWQPYITIDAGKDTYGLEQARVVKFDVIGNENDAWCVAKTKFLDTPNSVAFSIEKV